MTGPRSEFDGAQSDIFVFVVLLVFLRPSSNQIPTGSRFFPTWGLVFPVEISLSRLFRLVIPPSETNPGSSGPGEKR